MHAHANPFYNTMEVTMVTIVFAHPWHGSFNHAILETLKSALEKKQKKYQIIDLNKDQFNPVFSESELALFSRGQHLDPLVTQYQNMLSATDELIFVFPIWWYDLPAILKGFIDKVMLKNFSYEESKFGLKGKLTHIKKTKVITTGQSPRWYIQYFRGNAIKKTFMDATLKDLGIKNATWLHCGDVSKGAQQKREQFLLKLRNEV